MKNMKAAIIDVRTPGEFMEGNIAGSINIPLNELPGRVEEIKQLCKPVILCCASGARSAHATAYLKNMAVECENGGSWLSVEHQYRNN
jgi:phage shock protein E